MATLVDKATGKTVNVDDGDADLAISTGAFAPASGRVNVNIPGKGLLEVDSSALPDLIKSAGAKLETPAEAEERRLQKEHGTGFANEAIAGLEGAARGATLGISDQVERGLGVSQEGMRERAARNTSAVPAEIVGSAAPLLLTDGAAGEGVVARGASLLGSPVRATAALGNAVERSALKGLTGALGEGAAKKAIAKFGARAASGAVEGVLAGAGHVVSEDALGNADLNGESLAAAMGTGALLGGVLGGGLGLAGDVVGAGISKGASAIKKKIGSGELAEGLDTFAERQAVDALGATQSKIQRLQNKDRLEEVGRDLLTEHEALGGEKVLHKMGDLDITASNVAKVREHAGKMKGDALEELSTAAQGIGATEREQIAQASAKAQTDFDGRLAELQAQRGELSKFTGEFGASKAKKNSLGEDVATESAYGHGSGSKKKIAALDDQISEMKAAHEKQIAELAKTADQTHVSFSGRDVANRFRRELSDESINTPVFQEEHRKIADMVERFTETGRMTLKEADNLKQRLQAEAQRDYDKLTGQYSFAGEMRMKAAAIVRDEINGVAAQVAEKTGSAAALTRFTEGNRLFGSMSEASKLIEQGIARKQGNRAFSLTDNIQGAGAFAGALAGGIGAAPAAIGGLAVGAANKFLRERGNALTAHFVENTRKLAWVARATEGAAAKIDGAIDKAVGAIKTAGNRARIASAIETPRVLHDVSFAPESKVAKNDDDAFKQRVQEVADIASNPELLANRLEQSAPSISGAAPKISNALSATATRAAGFLHQMAPKNPKLPMGLGSSAWRPSRAEIDTFSRYVAAVNDPMSVIRDLERGTVTQQGVEALRAVYPALYNKVQTRIVEELSEHADKIDYRDKVQLSVLLGTPLDETLTPEYSAAIAQAFRSNAPQQQTPRPSSNAAKTSASGSAMTDTQRIQMGRGS